MEQLGHDGDSGNVDKATGREQQNEGRHLLTTR